MAKPIPITTTTAIRFKGATNGLFGFSAREVEGAIAGLSLGWLVLEDGARLVVDFSQMADAVYWAYWTRKLAK